MLIEHLWVLIAQCRSHSDGQLSVRANLGTGFVPSIFGLNVSVFEDKMPWIENYFNRILKPLKGQKKTLIFTPCGGNEKDWQNPDDVISLWRSLQG